MLLEVCKVRINQCNTNVLLGIHGWWGKVGLVD